MRRAALVSWTALGSGDAAAPIRTDTRQVLYHLAVIPGHRGYDGVGENAHYRNDDPGSPML